MNLLINKKSLAFAVAIWGIASIAPAQTVIYQSSPQPGRSIGYVAIGGADLNGDGIPDIVATNERVNPAVTWFSGLDGSVTRFENYTCDSCAWTSLSLAFAGDMDADGVADIALGNPEEEDLLGDIRSQLFVISGHSGGIIYQIKQQFNPSFGASVAGIGDANLDGSPDVAAGQGSAVPMSTDEDYYHNTFDNGVAVRLGPSGSLSLTMTGATGSNFGYAVADGDYNSDGAPEILVSSLGINQCGVYNSTTGALRYSVAGTTTFGKAIARIGDVNADGYPDFAVGNPQNAGNGSVSVYSGRGGSLLYIINGFGSGSRFGRGLGVAGDLNLDGVPDITVGAPHELHGNHTNAGAVYLFQGQNGGLLGAHAGSANDDKLGFSTGSAGDVNGDGFPDVFAVAPGSDFFGAYKPGYIRILSLAPGLSQYGEGTPGCNGKHWLNTNPAAKINTPNFYLTSSAAPPNSLGLGLIVDAPLAIPQDPFGLGADFLVDLLTSTDVNVLDLNSNSNGFGYGNIAIPNDPLLVGLTRFAQVFWYWGGGPCSPSASGLSSSDLLTITIQN